MSFLDFVDIKPDRFIYTIPKIGIKVIVYFGFIARGNCARECINFVLNVATVAISEYFCKSDAHISSDSQGCVCFVFDVDVFGVHTIVFITLSSDLGCYLIVGVKT